MKGRDALKAVIVLALASACGIVGLLLADGAWDALLLVLAASPLAVGLWRWRAEARAGGR
ncbi:hypothetical protein [Vulcaniibacterium tengchongense]|uniref:Uncharacterized protein n=1 Tax=Vulcaniibacterium tengchongense TaxID=1273429 RepID=A0A3N4VKK7_9GAMM|nr:hypothetical protein [Vulcaniibacterium tengchongense]RPE79811.1 hypothetical protein EDC50_1637 [Vulcaniibacterium tengchongense]